MKKLTTIAFTVAAILNANLASVMASGNPYEAYSPYQTHTPVDTGFDDTSTFYVIALVAFAAGLSILAISKNLKGSQATLED